MKLIKTICANLGICEQNTGEALAETTETGTVEAALESGKHAAELIMKVLS